MIVNATLVLQIVHFGITYFLLSRILLYPAARMLKREDAAHDRILHDIGEIEQRVQEYESFREQQWQRCVHALAHKKPDGPYFRRHTRLGIVPSRDISTYESHYAPQKIRDVIMRKARDG